MFLAKIWTSKVGQSVQKIAVNSQHHQAWNSPMTKQSRSPNDGNKFIICHLRNTNYQKPSNISSSIVKRWLTVLRKQICGSQAKNGKPTNHLQQFSANCKIFRQLLQLKLSQTLAWWQNSAAEDLVRWGTAVSDSSRTFVSLLNHLIFHAYRRSGGFRRCFQSNSTKTGGEGERPSHLDIRCFWCRFHYCLLWHNLPPRNFWLQRGVHVRVSTAGVY